LNRSQALAVSILAILFLATLPAQRSVASGSYSEKLNVYVAGSSALWYFTFDGVNGSKKMTSFENSPGLSWYNVTAIKTTGWVSDFQIFGPQGYNLIPVPFIPQQGLFLALGSDSYADALAAAGRLDSYFAATFVSLSNGTNSFQFYSPVSFGQIIPTTLMNLLPSSAGGFASTIAATSFENTLSPFITLRGVEGPSGLVHTLVVGSIASNALSKHVPNILSYFGKNVTSLSAAKTSLSSTIEVKVLDGLMFSKDDAVVTNVAAQFASTYTLSIPPGKKTVGINSTVLQQPLQLVAVRNIDEGVLHEGTNVSVSITLTNLSNETTLNNVTYSDNWWNPALFRLVRGSSTYFSAVFNASQTVTTTYVLQYMGNTTGRVTMPNTEVNFAYKVGPSTYKGHSWVNPIGISLGEDDAVVYAYISPSTNTTEPVGNTLDLNLVVKNVGTRSASPVIANGVQINTLLADGGTKTVPISVTSSGLLGTNLTKTYLVTYVGAQGKQFNATSNLLPVDFGHSGMSLGFASVSVTASLTPLKIGSTAVNLTLTYTVTNKGSATISSFLGKEVFPNVIGCGLTKGKGISCSSNLLTLQIATIAAGKSNQTTTKINVINLENVFIPPVSFQGHTAGINFAGKSSALALPTGYILTKQFSPSSLFRGGSSTVTLVAVNHGPYYVYNVTVASTRDSFDSLSSLAVASVSNASISPHGNLSKSYVVIASSEYGNHSASAITSTVFFGGNKFSLQNFGEYVSVYQPLTATVTAVPSAPVEGKSFHLNVVISNPTGVSVTDAKLAVPIPAGLTLSGLTNGSVSNGVLTVSVTSLPSHTSFNATSSAVVGSGTTLSFSNENLTFMYNGVTYTGSVKNQQLTIAEDLTSRYLLPIGIAIVALLATAFYVRQISQTTGQFVQQ